MITNLYREAYGVFAVNGILFNHESDRRGKTFVTKKITRGLVRIKYGLQKKLIVGNLNSKRDWGMQKTMWWLNGSCYKIKTKRLCYCNRQTVHCKRSY